MSDAEMSDMSGDEDIVRQHENKDGEEEEEDDEDDLNRGDEVMVNGNQDQQDEAKKVTPKKKKVTRKMIVLNTKRLKGPKGAHTIEKLYEGFRYRGKGYEKQDLDRVMKRLEYWCFRLFPKLDFDDILDKCEHLGQKKDMQVFLNRYRLGMVTADDIMAHNDTIEEEDKEDDVAISRTESALLQEIENDDFQRLFDEVDLRTVEQQVQQTEGQTS